MKLVLTLCLAAALWAQTPMLTAWGTKWSVVDGSDWKVETLSGHETLELVKARGPLPGPRRPIQFALSQTASYTRVRMTGDVRPRQRSLMLMFAYRDPAHFDYAHLSIDTGLAQPVHNGIFHVFGGERVRISSQAGPAAFPASDRWYHVVLEWDGQNGEASVTVDGKSIPALRAVDLSLHSGRVGLGSFDETADFRNIEITGSAVHE